MKSLETFEELDHLRKQAKDQSASQNKGDML